jgi:leader peptidase (prepilin peptidase) / N-methyltransferase
MPHQAGFWVFALVAGGIFGLLIGSFLNVVIYRIPRGMSIAQPPSHCPSCGTELRPWDNVPVASWLALRARCRYCGTSISARYPLVEAATGVTFVALVWAVPTFWALPSLFVIAACAIAAAGIDVDGLAVPWSISIVAGVGAAALAVVAAAVHQEGRIGWAAVGLVAASAAGLIAGRSGERLRRAALAASLGWAAGWLWPPGGAVLALWILVAAGLVTLVGRAGRPTGTGPRTVPATLARAAMWAGGIVVLVAAAAISQPG